ncbi:uncharacterized protein LOC129919198 [Episyrphus balteatus]|uniref:uncharacterized protein LOC129919198 n=1 Tax=Episyrphus balteatus TaxID=286459 RepID=UPI002484D77F|nr:uncharacterized protein LOC129919198 [Episyrphus balteatus]
MKWQIPIVLQALLAFSISKPTTAAINSTFVIGIIERLYDAYPMKTLPIFWSRYIEPTDSLFSNISQQLFQKYPIPQMHFTESSNQELRYLLDANTTLSIVLTDHMSMEILKIVATRLRGMHLAKLLLVLREPVLLDQLRFFQNWLWEKQFTNALVLYQDKLSKQNQIFTLNAYPVLKWVNRTGLTDPTRLFMPDTKDMKQYPVEILYMEDVPRVFILKENGKKKIVGRHANLIQLFAKHMNIKLVYNFQPNLDLEKILREFHTQNMELSVHSYSMFDLEEIGSSYPLETVRWCIMVPLRSEVPKSDYVIISFDRATWIATGLSVIYIALLLRFIDPPSSETPQKYFFLRSLAILMYSPNMAERMTMPTVRQFLFFAQVFLLGFVLSCIYSTYLTSFCTNMVFQPPIDSVADLVKENLRVMVIDYELEAIRTRAIYGETFLKLLYPVSYIEVNQRRAKFDEHYAYSIRQDRWNFLNKQQRGLEKVFFRLSKICFGRHFTMFPLQFDSHLRTHMDMFILIIMQAGLDLFWDEEAFRMAVSMKFSKVLVEQTVVVQPLRLDYFKHVYAGYWSLIGISTLIFIVEVLHEKFFFIRRALARAKALEDYVQNEEMQNKSIHEI